MRPEVKRFIESLFAILFGMMIFFGVALAISTMIHWLIEYNKYLAG